MIGNNMIYLDNSATTRPFPEAVERMTRSMLDTYFNPHAAYSPAVHVERETEECRRHMREAFGDAGEIIFTSGGTESNNMSILGTLAVLHSPRPHIVPSGHCSKAWQERGKRMCRSATPERTERSIPT